MEKGQQIIKNVTATVSGIASGASSGIASGAPAQDALRDIPAQSADQGSVRAAAQNTLHHAAHHVVQHPAQSPAPAQDIAFMQQALAQARKAARNDEVPIGAVVVYDGSVIAQAGNRREIDANPAGHAEFLAMQQAAQSLGAWRLSGCSVYVTLEPCLMCAGLMYQARIDRCVFGAWDPKAGALGSLYQINADERLNHRFTVTAGVCQEECSQLLKDFFARKRQQKSETS